MKKIAGIVLSLLLTALLLKLFIPNKNIQTKVNEVKGEMQVQLDKTMNQISKENRFLDSIKLLIATQKLNEAENIIDQLILKQPNDTRFRILKGQIFENTGRYDSAVDQYNWVIARELSPLAFEKRAQAFLKMRKYDDAVKDYKQAFEQNHYYSLSLAKLFQQLGKKDSALKYYEIYLEHYPDTTLSKK